MPVVHFHLIEGQHTDDAIGALLVGASHFYAETLYADVTPLPLDRVRAFATFSGPQHWATAGVLISDGGHDAPYFTCLTLAGRPIEQLHRLLAGFTDLIVTHLACERARVRGQVVPLDPVNWSIGGVPASAIRAAEIARRNDQS